PYRKVAASFFRQRRQKMKFPAAAVKNAVGNERHIRRITVEAAGKQERGGLLRRLERIIFVGRLDVKLAFLQGNRRGFVAGAQNITGSFLDIQEFPAVVIFALIYKITFIFKKMNR